MSVRKVPASSATNSQMPESAAASRSRMRRWMLHTILDGNIRSLVESSAERTADAKRTRFLIVAGLLVGVWAILLVY